MVILIDTREQRPFRFDRFECEMHRVALPTGDYSTAGYEAAVAIKRKGSLDELIMCLSKDRGRFERELQRAVDSVLFAVIIEGRFDNLAAGRYRSRLSSKAAVASLAAFTVRYCPFLFCGSRAGVELMTFPVTRKVPSRSLDGPSIHWSARLRPLCSRTGLLR
jgi:DNA excision repair protein ERCC-4